MRDDDGVVEDSGRRCVERRGVEPEAGPEADFLDCCRFRSGLEVASALQWSAVLDVARRGDDNVLFRQCERVRGPLEVKGDEVGGGNA